MRLADRTDQQFISGRPKDLAEELGSDGIRTIIKIICDAYIKLRNSGVVTPDMSEPEITEELYYELLGVWANKTSLRPIHEKSHGRRETGPGKTPTIDFCFRARFPPNSYFGTECKLLKENDNGRYKDYVAGGVCRYLTGKYSESCSIGSMIGYITSGNTGDIITEVKNRVDKVYNVSKMQKSDPINSFNEHYKSAHNREVDFSIFHIHHLFFSFA